MRRNLLMNSGSLKVAIAFFMCTSYTVMAQQVPLKKDDAKSRIHSPNPRILMR